jgi:hypothetical protein
MQASKSSASAKFLAVLAISVVLAVAGFYWKNSSSEKSRTEYVKTQQTEPSADIGGESRKVETRSIKLPIRSSEERSH